jgi:hypothetical protein
MYTVSARKKNSTIPPPLPPRNKLAMDVEPPVEHYPQYIPAPLYYSPDWSGQAAPPVHSPWPVLSYLPAPLYPSEPVLSDQPAPPVHSPDRSHQSAHPSSRIDRIFLIIGMMCCFALGIVLMVGVGEMVSIPIGCLFMFLGLVCLILLIRGVMRTFPNKDAPVSESQGPERSPSDE